MTAPDPQYQHHSRPVIFVSDLHLGGEPGTFGCFHAFCTGPARHAEALYVLGDLFDVWIGDDDPEPAYTPIFEALAELTRAGTDVRFIAGNRDFLIGEAFCRRTGVERLDDHALVDLFGTRTLLCHGDTLCTDDVEYQRFRAQVRTEQWQQEFLAKPLPERRNIAEGMRGGSRDAMANKENATMDVNPEAMCEALRHYGAQQLIHGHTHRPAHHQHAIDGATVNRYVLSDWPQSPSMIVAAPDGLRVEALDC